jgi:signal transduction histidine kinase
MSRTPSTGSDSAGAGAQAVESPSTGLQGLRERVGAYGGTLEAGPTQQGGWRVSAQLPRQAAVGAS